MEMDPSDFDPANIMQRNTTTLAQSSLMDPTHLPSSSPPQSEQYASTAEVEKFKRFQCVYPLYFDTTRSRAQGRRVGKAQAVANPLARDIVDAISGLGLKALFEPGKLHPKDWSNPGPTCPPRTRPSRFLRRPCHAVGRWAPSCRCTRPP